MTPPVEGMPTMTAKRYTIWGGLATAITFLLTAKASGMEGIDWIPSIMWLLIGGFNAMLTFILGAVRDANVRKNGGT